MIILYKNSDVEIILASIHDKYNVSLPRLIELKIEKFMQDIDKKRSRIAWSIVVLRYIRETETSEVDIPITYNDYGKPLIDNFHFNISHHGDYIVVGFSKTNIGIDISGETGRKINLHSFRNCFTSLEFSMIQNEHDFHKYWSAKEAFVKFLGKGLLIPLETISISFDNDQVIAKYEETITMGKLILYQNHFITFFS